MVGDIYGVLDFSVVLWFVAYFHCKKSETLEYFYWIFFTICLNYEMGMKKKTYYNTKQNKNGSPHPPKRSHIVNLTINYTDKIFIQLYKHFQKKKPTAPKEKDLFWKQFFKTSPLCHKFHWLGFGLTSSVVAAQMLTSLLSWLFSGINNMIVHLSWLHH